MNSVSRALEGTQKDKRNEDRKRGKEINSTCYTVTDQLPRAFSCIILTLQRAEKDILLSSNQNRLESRQTLNSQKEEIRHYRHLRKKY